MARGNHLVFGHRTTLRTAGRAVPSTKGRTIRRPRSIVRNALHMAAWQLLPMRLGERAFGFVLSCFGLMVFGALVFPVRGLVLEPLRSCR